MKTITKTVLATTVLVVQIVAICWLIWRYESIVRHGTEVRFRCEAYDPYDPLRGRYLRTTVRETCPEIVGGMEGPGNMDAAYAKLVPSTNGLWHIAAVAKTPQSDGELWIKPKWVRIEHSLQWSAKGKDESWEDFQKRRDASPLAATVALPDQLFLNEHLAPAAEKVLRDATSAKGKGAVAVYRARDGEIVITDIEIDGKSVIARARENAQNEVHHER